MTTRDQARRTFRRPLQGDRNGGAESGEPPGPSLPERLVAAREAKGVDLYRAERDTKIRARYLSALERGSYSELPGTVYTRGFLRNYALYLGLDADDVLTQWRRERGEVAARPVAVVPRPLQAPRQGLVVSGSTIVLALLLVVVAAVAGYFIIQITRFVQPLQVAVSEPASGFTTVSETSQTYTFRGTATAGMTVQISVDGNPAESVIADRTGHWSFVAPLHKGSNQFDVSVVDISTQKTGPDTVVRKILVPIPTIAGPVAPQLTIDTPAEGSSFQNGAVLVTGKATSATKVSVTPTYVGAPLPAASAAPGSSASPSMAATPQPTPTAAPSPTPSPSSSPSNGASASPGASGSPGASASPPGNVTTVNVASDGSFSIPVQLTAGRWQLTVTASNEQGQSTSQTRGVNVVYRGVQVVVEFKGGAAWLKVWRDGAVDASLSNKTYKSGQTITVVGNESVWIRTGAPSVTYVTVNGTSYGALGKAGRPGSWRFTPGQLPKASNDF